MSGTSAPTAVDLARRFGAFVAERYPFALAPALAAFEGASHLSGKACQPPFAGSSASSPAGRAAQSPDSGEVPPVRPGRDHARRRGRGPARRRRGRTNRCLRRVPQARGNPRNAHARGAPRNPARHDPDASDRQPAEVVLHRRRSPIRRRGLSRQRVSLAWSGGDLRRRDPAAPR